MYPNAYPVVAWCHMTLRVTWGVDVTSLYIWLGSFMFVKWLATHCNKLPHYNNWLSQQHITLQHHSTSDWIHSCSWNGWSNGAITHTSTLRMHISICDMTHLCPHHPSMSICDMTHLCPHHPSMSICDMTHLCPHHPSMSICDMTHLCSHHPSMSTCHMIHLWCGWLQSVESIKS